LYRNQEGRRSVGEKRERDGEVEAEEVDGGKSDG
jgi:hypothetical protein